jgi:hypothetical protein
MRLHCNGESGAAIAAGPCRKDCFAARAMAMSRAVPELFDAQVENQAPVQADVRGYLHDRDVWISSERQGEKYACIC